MSTIGNGRIDAIESRYMTFSDTAMPVLALAFDGIAATQGDLVTDQVSGASITYAKTAKELTISIKSRDFAGDDAADVDWTITGGAAKVAWSGRAATALSLKDWVDLLNEIPGISAHALHAPYAMSVNNTNILAMAETPIGQGAMPGGYTECMYRDVSAFTEANSDKVCWMRVGLPEARDGNAFDLVDIMGSSAGVTNGLLKVYRDNLEDYGEDEHVYAYETLAASSDGYLGTNKLEAMTVRGPVIVEARSDNMTAANLFVHIKQAQIGA